MKANKPNKHELPAVVRLAWAVDFAVRQKRYSDIDPAIVALRNELDRLEAETDASFKRDRLTSDQLATLNEREEDNAKIDAGRVEYDA